MDRFDAHVTASKAQFVAELQDLCRLPSVSAHRRSIPETAEAVAARMRVAGLTARVLPVDGGSPVVIAEAGAGRRTLLVYGHYDVQPAEPLDAWHSDPFVPEIRDGRIYARGISDNKGPIMARILAVESWLRTMGDLPIRVRFLIEGEEEIGSPHLAEVVRAHADALRADLALWDSNGRDSTGHPMATLGQKGLASFNLRVRTARQDLHSMWGTLVPNAIWRMVWALATLKDSQDRIQIDGLMDAVRPPAPAEMALLSQIPFNEARLQDSFGISGFVRALSGREALVKHLLEPTCTINGISGGYTGPGGKTVLPAKAEAKVDIRLVPGLAPDRVSAMLRAHLDRRGFDDVEIELTSGLSPFRCPPDHPMVALALRAAEETYGEPVVVYPTSPGSGPMAVVCEPLGFPAISVGGMNHSAANAHGPDENIYIGDYILGIRFVGRLTRTLGKP